MYLLAAEDVVDEHVERASEAYPPKTMPQVSRWGRGR